jgi:hypothetical protein
MLRVKAKKEIKKHEKRLEKWLLQNVKKD